MKKKPKRTQITMRTSEEQKAFLQQRAKDEGRTITSVINLALNSRYPAYKKIAKGKGE